MRKKPTEETSTIILNKPVNKYIVINDETIYYQLIGSKALYSRSIKDLTIDNVIDKKLFADNYLTSWDVQDDKVFYTVWRKKDSRQVLYEYDTKSTISEELFTLTANTVLSNQELNVVNNGAIIYYNKRNNLSSDIVLMSQH